MPNNELLISRNKKELGSFRLNLVRSKLGYDSLINNSITNYSFYKNSSAKKLGLLADEVLGVPVPTYGLK